MKDILEYFQPTLTTEPRRRGVRQGLRAGLCALFALTLGLSAGTAQAALSCPARSIHPAIASWRMDAQGNGVYMCRGRDSSGNYMGVTVQMVDFTAGAKMRVMSEVAAGSPVGTASTQFVKRKSKEWYDWIKAGNVGTPPASQLFSVTNASLFRSAFWGNTSAMSFPQKKWSSITSTGEDPNCHLINGSSAKRMFGLSDPRAAGRQNAYMNTFNQGCKADFNTASTQLSGYFDAVVAYHPIYGVDETTTDNRTYLGTKNLGGYWTLPQDIAYVLTSTAHITTVRAREILTNDFGSMWTMQLDGGGSTQYYHAAYSDADYGWGPRAVPEVLAIYAAP